MTPRLTPPEKVRLHRISLIRKNNTSGLKVWEKSTLNGMLVTCPFTAVGPGAAWRHVHSIDRHGEENTALTESFTSISIWPGPGVWRSPEPSSTVRLRWFVDFNTTRMRKKKWHRTNTTAPSSHTGLLPFGVWTDFSHTCPWTRAACVLRARSLFTHEQQALAGRCFDSSLHRVQSGCTFICLRQWMYLAVSAEASFFMLERAKTIGHPPGFRLIWILKSKSFRCAPIYTT